MTAPERQPPSLPHLERPFGGVITELATQSTPARPEIERAPAGAPNVVVVMFDDVGFGAASTFGGPVPTPALDRVAAAGVTYNQFHTTALCSPTRAALLTGRNHHSAHMGGISEIAYGFPGYDGIIPRSTATVAEILRLNGYSTAMFGKAHVTPMWETSPAGPFDRWPTGLGFERFYGFLGGEASQWEPALYDQTTPVEPYVGRDGYHLTEDLADRTIEWMRLQKAAAPDKPFFVYFSPGATHAPHHVWPEWIERFKGRFDSGWDVLREEIHARQLALGVIPPGTALTPRPQQIPSWDEYPDRYKPVARRLMEVYAGFLAHTDAQVGRVLDALDELGQTENTMVVYLMGDNGASGRGRSTAPGARRRSRTASPRIRSGCSSTSTTSGRLVREPLQRRLGVGARRPVPVDEAGRLALRRHPQRHGRLLAGRHRRPRRAADAVPPRDRPGADDPRGRRGRGARRRQRHRTEADRGPESAIHVRRCRRAKPAHDAVLRDPRATARSTTRAGWPHASTAGCRGRDPRQSTSEQGSAGSSTTSRTTSARPSMSPPSNRSVCGSSRRSSTGRLGPSGCTRSATRRRCARCPHNRPSLLEGKTHFTLYRDHVRLPELASVSLKNTSFDLRARLSIPEGGAEGVVICQGGNMAGWSLYRRRMGDRRTTTTCSAGSSRRSAEPIRYLTATSCWASRSTTTAEGSARAGRIRLTVDGRQVAGGRLERTVPFLFSMSGETLDVGVDTGSPVGPYPHRFPFTGGIERIEIDLRPALDAAERAAVDDGQRRGALASQ